MADPESPRWVLFDLDGTLTDSAPGITRGVHYALTRLGLAPPRDAAVLRRFIGPPLQESFERICGLPEATAREAVTHYRVYYRDRGLFETEVYAGIPELLDALRDHHFRLAVATAKPEPYARRIVEHFGLAPYFRHLVGARLDGTRLRKDEIIAHALNVCGITDLSRVVMVGDREHDVQGAAVAGIDCLGVLWGYGTREELTTAGAVRLAATVEEAKSILLPRK